MTLTSDVLLYEVTDGVAEVTLNRPDRLNALDDVLIPAIAKAMALAAHDDSVRAILLTGAGRGFCAGADLKFMMAKALAGPTEPPPVMFHTIAGALHDGISTIRRTPKPTVCALNGPAAGAGVGYALACDIVWAAKDATIRLAYTNIGLAPDGGTTYLVTRAIGERKALELYYSAEVVDADRALALGFVSRVLPTAELLGEARAFARKLAKGPSIAFGLAKQLVGEALREGLETQMERERQAIVRTSTTEDFMEGVGAFLQKRPPEFKGR